MKTFPVIWMSARPPAESGGDAGASLYAAHQKVYPREVKGRFASLRWAMVWLTQLVFYGLAWLPWGDRQAVLFDLASRRFYLFGAVLYPQDFIYLTGLLVASALSLFLFTALAGRLWCGFACPQTVYTEIFLWIERRIEGDRSARLRLDKGPMTAARLAKKSVKHALWLTVALWTGFTFVGYFTPIHTLAQEVQALNMGSWEIFWVGFYGFATYGNAGFMREQVCKYMCPYARFQSAMFDRDTLIVSYDTARGEPRGPRAKSAAAAAATLGACIDCTMCVQVCPTGIDIRKGLQYECIGCAACVDACDAVMDKTRQPRGLIRFTTERALQSPTEPALRLRRLLRPRVLVYGGILSVLCMALLAGLWLRAPFRVDVVRDRASLARLVPGGKLENVYRLQIMNATETAQHYRVTAEGLEGLTASADGDLTVNPAASRWVPVRLRIVADAASAGSHPVRFVVTSEATGTSVVEKAVFIVPR